ncbi:MAG: CHAT domain-containing protein, partial [Symploca sp. SIO2E6]|nr:CHAT domain-containing protein [Symploca sp. SIO2E6]
LGHAYNSLGAFDQATEYLKQSLQIAMEIGDIQGEGESLESLGLALHNSDKLAEAEQNLRQAIARYEEIRKGLGNSDDFKVSVFEKQTLAYSLLQQVLVAQNKPLEALEVAERGRNRALVEMLFRHGNEELAERIIPPSPNIEEIRRIARQQNATIVEYSVIPNLKYAGITSQEKNLSPQIYIWVIQPDGNIELRSVQIPEYTSLKEFITSKLYELINGSNPTIKVENSAKKMYQILINPIAELLHNNEERQVIFIPHKELFLFPFVALMDTHGKYLIEKHTILTAPSIQSLGLTSKQKKSFTLPRGGEALVVGNPILPSGYDYPQGVEEETYYISQLLENKPISGAAATEPIIVDKMANAKLIHFASHGLFKYVDNNSLRPANELIDTEYKQELGAYYIDEKIIEQFGKWQDAIILTSTGDKPSQDGILTSKEIIEQFGLPGSTPLQAEMVVLSFCQSGRGRITGEGIIGLARSFIAVGVPSLVISMWSVDDSSTAYFMEQFYFNFYVKRLDKAQALRKVQLAMIRSHRLPSEWAAFTLIGQP